jgi:hypothetical protein
MAGLIWLGDLERTYCLSSSKCFAIRYSDYNACCEPVTGRHA